jgi:hypothetical protein
MASMTATCCVVAVSSGKLADVNSRSQDTRLKLNQKFENINRLISEVTNKSLYFPYNSHRNIK